MMRGLNMSGMADTGTVALDGSCLRTGFDLWQFFRPVSGLPSPADLNPARFVRLAPTSVLLDVAAERWDFRFRRVGERVAALLEAPVTGAWMSECAGMGPASPAFETARLASRKREPMMTEAALALPVRQPIDGQAVFLPLAWDGRTVDTLLLVMETEGPVALLENDPHPVLPARKPLIRH